eukprot:s573_g18.t1
MLGDKETIVRQAAMKALVSYWDALRRCSEVLKSEHVHLAGAEGPGAFPCKEATIVQFSDVFLLIKSGIPALAECLSDHGLKRDEVNVVLSLWHTLEKLGEDPTRSENAGLILTSTLLGIVKTQMAQMVDSCLDSCIALLSDDDTSVRLVAAQVLERVENHKIKSLALALRDPERSTPVTAAKLKREIASFEEILTAVSPLVEGLNSMTASAKVAVIEVIGSFWDSLGEFDDDVMRKAAEVCCDSESSKCIRSLQSMTTLYWKRGKPYCYASRSKFVNKLFSVSSVRKKEFDDWRMAAAMEFCKFGLPKGMAIVQQFLRQEFLEKEYKVSTTGSAMIQVTASTRFAQSTRILAKSVAACKEPERGKIVDKAMALFVKFIAARKLKVKKLGLEAVRIIGRQGLPVLMRTLECGSPDEQTAAAVGLWVVEKDFFLRNPITPDFLKQVGCEAQASPDAMKLLLDDVEDRLYGKQSASPADSTTSLPVVQAGSDRKMKNRFGCWNRFVSSCQYCMGLVVDLPSPWTLVASAIAFLLFSSQHPLAELLSHPNTLVRSHHHRHWGFPMYGSWLLERGLESRHSWDAWKSYCLSWFRRTSVPAEEPFEQVLSLDEEERFCAALQAFQLLTRFEVVPKSDLCDPPCAAVFAHFGLKINRKEGQLVLSSNPQRPGLLNVEAIERIVHRGFFPERFHDTSPVLHVLRPWWLLVDIVVVLLQVAICVLIMVIPLALFSVHELARESFYPMSPVDSLTSVHFGPRFAQLSQRLLFSSPGLTWFSFIYAASLFLSLVFAYCTEALPLAQFPILQTLMGNKSTSVVQWKRKQSLASVLDFFFPWLSSEQYSYRQWKCFCDKIDKMAVPAKVFFKGIPWLAFSLLFAQVSGFGALFCCWLGFGVVVEPARFVPLVSTLASFVFAVAGRVRSLRNWRRSLAKCIDEVFQSTANILWISLLERMNIVLQDASYQRLLEGIASDMDLFELLAQGQQNLRRSFLEEFLRPLIDQRAFAMLVSDILTVEDRVGLTEFPLAING